MPRLHILSSWVGACEYDEGDTYSGEQVGRRSQKSVGVTIERDGDQWKGRQTKKQSLTVPITHTINPHAAKLDKLDQQEKRLLDAFMADEIDAEQYEASYYTLCMQREKTYKAYMKSIGQEKEWQQQNAEQLAEYRREEQKPGWQPIEWQSVVHNVTNAGKRFYRGMAAVLAQQIRKAVAYGHTKQEFEGEDVAFWGILGVCAVVVSFQVGRTL